jgi:hypothetical protein
VFYKSSDAGVSKLVPGLTKAAASLKEFVKFGVVDAGTAADVVAAFGAKAATPYVRVVAGGVVHEYEGRLTPDGIADAAVARIPHSVRTIGGSGRLGAKALAGVVGGCGDAGGTTGCVVLVGKKRLAPPFFRKLSLEYSTKFVFVYAGGVEGDAADGSGSDGCGVCGDLGVAPPLPRLVVVRGVALGPGLQVTPYKGAMTREALAAFLRGAARSASAPPRRAKRARKPPVFAFTNEEYAAPASADPFEGIEFDEEL